MLACCPPGKIISSECLWDSGRRNHKLCEKRQKVGKEEEEEGKERGIVDGTAQSTVSARTIQLLN